MKGAPAVEPTSDTAPPRARVLAAELIRRAEDERRLAHEARSTPTAGARDRIAACRAGERERPARDRRPPRLAHRRVRRRTRLHGGPDDPSALPDLGFQLTCRDLIAEAVADGRCPAVHHAYIADHCAVALNQPQFYGTRINPGTLFPYPVRHPETVDERRHDVGLGPLAEHLRAVRCGLGASGGL